MEISLAKQHTGSMQETAKNKKIKIKIIKKIDKQLYFISV